MNKTSMKKQPVLINASEARKIAEVAMSSIVVLQRSLDCIGSCAYRKCDSCGRIETAINLLENMIENFLPENDPYIDLF